MGKIGGFEDLEIKDAVLVWTGWKRDVKPRRDEAAFVQHFGPNAASRLLPIVKSLEDDFYASDARLVAANLIEMEKLSSEDFRRKHPDTDPEVAMAFAWCYTFDYK